LGALYKTDDISLIVIDSHVDSVPTSAMADAIQYDMATNPSSVYDPADPFLRNRPDSYNASSFIYYLLEEGLVNPRNLYLIGVSDYPPKKAFRIKDGRMKHYLDCYLSLKTSGAKILTKKDLTLGLGTLGNLLNKVKTPFVYISIDMDIGARNALNGVRFRNYQGINESQIYRIAKSLREMIDRGVSLVGIDLMEFNPRMANSGNTPDQDRTYLIALNLIKLICFSERI
ncbi:MAG: arginase family protein, partial [Desulfomonilaceae bacterium]